MRLEAEKLGAARGGQMLFSGLDFTLAPGETLLVTGPNGAGKSTLLRIAAGLLAPTEGRIALKGGTLERQAQYLSTANAMKPALTVAENLGFWRDFLSSSRDDDAATAPPGMGVEAALEAVGLRHTLQLPFGVLSTGQRRRVALARLLLEFRPLWLLDEPASGLDAAAAEKLSVLLRRHVARGGMVLAAVHDDPGLPDAKEIRLGLSSLEGAA